LLATSSRPFDGDEGAAKAAVNNPAKMSVNGRKQVTAVPLCSPVLHFSRTYYRSAEFEANHSVCRLFRLATSPKAKAGVAAETARVHTPTMTLKTAALLALIGTILMTALLMWTFFLTFLNVLRDLVPVVTLFSSFIYAFGCFSVAVFFYLFHRAQ
jgi:hypothetical protein